MKSILQFYNVSKSFGKKKVLESIRFDIPEGTFTTLIGCNGAGKSTILRIMAGLESREGQVTFKGIDPFSDKSTLSSEIFLVHENLPINYRISLKKFISIYREVFPKWNQSIFEKILLDRDLNPLNSYHEFSRGQKTQILLAMALSSGAELILCDEVTSMLDFDAQFYFLEALKKYTLSGGTVVMTTNILSELEEYADHVILVQATKIAIDSSLLELKNNYVVLSKTSEHPIFADRLTTPIRSREGASNLFLTSKQAFETFNASSFKTSLKPKLEDFILLQFRTKKIKNENMVA